MSVLVVGGTSGLGLEIARDFSELGKEVIVTGRHNPGIDFARYKEFDLATPELPRRIGEFVTGLPEVETIVYAAGFYQEGIVTDLTDQQVDEMIDVGGRGLVFFVKKILEKQGGLEELITVTSTSQWTPRQKESLYNFAKAGAGHFSNGLSLDSRVGKVLVAGPAGMKTKFYGALRSDVNTMMNPAWVAQQIMELRRDSFEYKFAKILREPNRVEIVETR